jgi:acetyl-CoA C-acetyltransferase
VRPDDLLAVVLKALMARNPTVDAAAIEDVVAGAANQAGEDNRNVARMAALLAGFPITVPGVTVNRLCASSLQAIVDVTRAMRCDDGGLYIAGGVESMTRAPFVTAKSETNPVLAAMYPPIAMGETAENLADMYKISREEQDQFALASQMKYKTALDAGLWDREMVPVSIAQRKGDPVIVNKDEHPRGETTLEGLAKLGPAFRKGGSVTAGNSSGINDGASALLFADDDHVKRFNLKPLARVVSTGVAGVDPAIMGIGPVPATQKALKRAGLSIADIGLAELNEAFAAQSIPCIRDLGLDPAIVNVNGGAIALGHPLGCSGARIMTTLVHEMQRRSNVRYGLATMCIGVGQGVAVIIEKA